MLNEWAAVLPVSVWELKTAQKIVDGHLKERMEGMNDSKGVCTFSVGLHCSFFASAVLIPIVFSVVITLHGLVVTSRQQATSQVLPLRTSYALVLLRENAKN